MTKTDKTVVAPSIASGKTFIGAAALCPLTEWWTAVPIMLFRGAMAVGLDRAGIKPAMIAAHYGLGFLVCHIEVHDKPPALQAIYDTLKDLDLLSYSEIAFYDSSEDFWRTVHPRVAPAPFERFLKAEVVELSLQRMRRDGTTLQEIAAKMAQANPGGPPKDQGC